MPVLFPSDAELLVACSHDEIPRRIADHFRRASCALLCLLVVSAPSWAEDIGPASELDVSFGAAFASNYVTRGISQSEGDPAVQGYVEFDYNLFYAGVWASNINYADDRGAELDFSIGVRPSLEDLSLDLGYVQFTFPGTEALSYGEFFAGVELPALDIVTIGAGVFLAPDYSQLGGTATYGELSASAELDNGFAVDGALGAQGFDATLDLPSYVTWRAGVSYTWNETATLGVHYTDSTLSADSCSTLMSSTACGAKFLATLSFDTTLAALQGRAR